MANFKSADAAAAALGAALAAELGAAMGAERAALAAALGDGVAEPPHADAKIVSAPSNARPRSLKFVKFFPPVPGSARRLPRGPLVLAQEFRPGRAREHATGRTPRSRSRIIGLSLIHISEP